MLIDGTNVTVANDILRSLDTRYNKVPSIFSLDSLFFGGLITAALDDEFQSQKSSLIQIRDELIGKQPYWKTYALKYNFTELFSPEMEKAFQWIIELLNLVENHSERIVYRERFEDLHESLYTFVYESLIPMHLPELLLGLLIHAALVLPIWRPSETSDTFDAANDDTSGGFSLIWPPPSLEDTYLNHTAYLRSLLRKIKGEEIVYVDLTIVPNHSLLNIR
jgi:hypothetical protein